MATQSDRSLGTSSALTSVWIRSLTINGSSLDLSGLGYLSGVTPGAASASRALDSSSNISGINSLQTTTLILGSSTLTSTEASYLIGLTTGVAQANKAITVNGSLNVSGINNISASGIGRISQPKATDNGCNDDLLLLKHCQVPSEAYTCSVTKC
ncbi:unnamed protein product [Phytophthora lilii]|uniref:Unnamed protein product n=1 Tax=Phytophthora lilii TaxID=2077276 RepID=A0A9W6WQL9_9STRA|nr:unnamed protein product [Phytophthora lilii]